MKDHDHEIEIQKAMAKREKPKQLKKVPLSYTIDLLRQILKQCDQNILNAQEFQFTLSRSLKDLIASLETQQYE